MAMNLNLDKLKYKVALEPNGKGFRVWAIVQYENRKPFLELCSNASIKKYNDPNKFNVLSIYSNAEILKNSAHDIEIIKKNNQYYMKFKIYGFINSVFGGPYLGNCIGLINKNNVPFQVKKALDCNSLKTTRKYITEKDKFKRVRLFWNDGLSLTQLISHDQSTHN